ncbi:MAG: tetratricopeptide repeat protein [Gammaproteobacteria bacterium]
MSSKRPAPRSALKLLPAVLTYVIAAWLAIGLVPMAAAVLDWPSWTAGLLVSLALVGLPLVLVLVSLRGRSRRPATADHELTPSVAILPFRDQSPEKNLDYLAEGLAEELQIVFSRTDGIRVASREACFAYKGKKVEIAEVAARLRVANVLTGRLRPKGEQLKASGKLIEARTGWRIWSNDYLHDADDIFEILVDMATELAASLGLVIDPAELRRLSSLQPEAYSLYLRGRRYYLLGGLDNTAHAVALFAQATESDPEFVRAWIALARAYAIQAIYFEGSEAERSDAHKASERAVELAPERGESHSVRGLAHLASEEYTAAATEFEHAIALDPSLWEAYYNYARAAYHQGRMQKALELFETAIRVNPEDYQSPTLAAPVYKHLGDNAGFEKAAQEGVQRAERHLEDYPENQRAWYLGAVALLYLGKLDRAMEWAEKSLAIDPSDPTIRYNMGCFYALAGNADRAFECLKGSISSRSWVEHDPDLEPIRDDPRYQQLLDSLEKSA